MKVIFFMGNYNVVYIDYIDSYLEIFNSKFPKWFRKFTNKILNYFGYIKISDNYFVLMCVENESINKRMINNLIKRIKSVNAKNIVLAEKFLQNNEFLSVLKKDFNILDGRWLYRFLILDIIQKISFIQNKKINEYEVTVLCNNPTELVFENIELLAKNCKIVNVLTTYNIDKFIHIEKDLYEKYGLLLNVSTNIRKACLFSDIIINIDFNSEDLEKCCFKDKSILVQCTKEKFEKNFKLVITFYRLNFSKNILAFLIK